MSLHWVLTTSLARSSFLCLSALMLFSQIAQAASAIPARVRRRPAGNPIATPAPTPMPAAMTHRGMWVWDSADVIGSSKTSQALISGALKIGVTDVYLYAGEHDYGSKRNQFAGFNASASHAGLRVWALDGARTYFDDASGPAPLFNNIEALVSFNNQVNADERFYGFQADNEPNDLDGHNAFHDGLTDAQLSRKPGSGVWQKTQADDRTMLMRSWLSMHAKAGSLLHGAGLKFGVAMPSWTSDYYGAPIEVSYPTSGSAPRSVTEHMMALVDEYVIMTYNVDPKNAANRALLQLQYASTLPATQRPKVYASVEVTPGVGENVSYADTPGKDSRATVLKDMATLTSILSPYPAFGGLAIEQWSGWDTLDP